ncbi:MAG: AI-2E family transporter [Chthoniobacterales bacterium]|nr:AI-2E family transporter [Chthoniobacterales bacterium]
MTPRASLSVGVRVTLAALGLLLALWLFTRLQGLVVLLLLSTTLATGVFPIVEWLEGRALPPNGWRLPRWIPIFCTLLAIVVVALGLFYFLGSVLWREGSQAWDDFPSYMDGLSGWLAGMREQFPQIPSTRQLALTAQKQIGLTGQYLWQTTSALLGVLGVIGSALTVLVLTFYMLLEREKLRAAFLSLIPPAHQKKVDETTAEALRTMGGWLRGQVILVLLMTTLISIAMALLGLPHPILLGMVGGLGELIPMVGPIAAGVIAVPLAFLLLPLWVGIATVAFFLVLSIVEGNVIVPKIMQANVGLPPFFTVVAVLAGATLYGVAGALLALPLAAALRVYLQRLVVPAIQKK